MELRQRPLVVEPVERLRDGDHVREPVRERDRLRRPVERLDVEAVELRPHLGHRLDRDDARARRREQASQLPRPGADVDDRPLHAEPASLRHPCDGLLGIRRTCALVNVGRAREAGRGDRMHARQLGVTR